MVAPVELDELVTAFGIDGSELISLVGGGGKTTTLFTLGTLLAGTTVLTTTTKMGAEQSGGFPVLIDPTDEVLGGQLARTGSALVWKAAEQRRAVGVDADTCDRWFDLADNIVVEADGSRKRPFKAPAAHEPVVPSRTTLLIACVGVSALGQPIEASCHRPDLVAQIAGCGIDDLLTPERASKVLLSNDGSQKGLPPGARFMVALHRVTPDSQHHADELAELLAGHAPLVAVQATTTSP